MKKHALRTVLLLILLCAFSFAACAEDVPPSVQHADWNNPSFSYTTTGSTNPDRGYLLTEEHLNRVLAVSENVGGWTRMYAPCDGDYHFTVNCDRLSSGTSFSIRIYRNGTESDRLYYSSGEGIHTQTITDVKAGDFLAWWEDDNTGRGYTFTKSFYLMVSAGDFIVLEPTEVPEIIPSAIQRGDLFSFGSFEQDTFAMDGKEPILWRVLDVDNSQGLVLAVSEFGLYTMKYHRNNKKTLWGKTDVRDWLNTTFLAGFTEEERAQIAEVSVSGSMDRFFLLDMAQIGQFLPSPYLCYATPYALINGEKGAYVSKDTGASSWLVRSDVAEKRIAFVGGGGQLYSPTGKKGVNYLTSKDNVVRPAMWVKAEAAANAAARTDFSCYALTNQKISTRSGPTTGYNGLGDYFGGGGQVVRVLSRVHDGSIWWLQVEFEYKGVMVRCYTGLKRVNINYKIVPEEANERIGTGTVVGDVTAYYGPGTHYKPQVKKYTPKDGTVGEVIKEENGWYCLEYESGKEHVRVWLPPEALVIQ